MFFIEQAHVLLFLNWPVDPFTGVFNEANLIEMFTEIGLLFGNA